MRLSDFLYEWVVSLPVRQGPQNSADPVDWFQTQACGSSVLPPVLLPKAPCLAPLGMLTTVNKPLAISADFFH